MKFIQTLTENEHKEEAPSALTSTLTLIERLDFFLLL